MRVWRTIVKIQRNFLWGGVAGATGRIPWVSWDDVCRPKNEGGLGVKNLKLFNLSLLAKWRWRLIVDPVSEFSKVLTAKYGEVRKPLLVAHNSKASLWWRDLATLGRSRVGNGDWILDLFLKKVGNERDTSFWLDDWCGAVSLREAFPRLYSLSNQPQRSIRDMGEWEGGAWVWKLNWRRPSFVWEEELHNRLSTMLESALISTEEDSWIYRLDNG
ncbi:putative ribonuclease H protein, partial [Trifolium medium]|nr:putative ribonuclease H protein [Trifolium medium]